LGRDGSRLNFGVHSPIGLRYTGKVVEPCLHLGADLLALRRT
jgi:hypothetical protein